MVMKGQSMWWKEYWQQTFSGKQFSAYDPLPVDVCIEDIAHGLSMICRFGGQCDRWYSVAQHSLQVAAALQLIHGCDAELELHGLLHDAGEAYIGDMVQPVKGHPRMDDYRFMEEEIMREAIYPALGLKYPDLSTRILIKHADKRMCQTERRDLFTKHLPWGPDWDAIEPYPHTLYPLSQPEAEERFLWAFHDLKAKVLK